VGWYHVFHRSDIVRIAPLWLEFCGKVLAGVRVGVRVRVRVRY
jgi:hypothetical protein